MWYIEPGNQINYSYWWVWRFRWDFAPACIGSQQTFGVLEKHSHRATPRWGCSRSRWTIPSFPSSSKPCWGWGGRGWRPCWWKMHKGCFSPRCGSQWSDTACLDLVSLIFCLEEIPGQSCLGLSRCLDLFLSFLSLSGRWSLLNYPSLPTVPRSSASAS